MDLTAIIMRRRLLVSEGDECRGRKVATLSRVGNRRRGNLRRHRGCVLRALTDFSGEVFDFSGAGFACCYWCSDCEMRIAIASCSGGRSGTETDAQG